jgi:PKD repeat protein
MSRRLLIPLVSTAVLTAMLVLPAAASGPQTTYVRPSQDDAATIQATIDSARPHQTIRLAPGRYELDTRLVVTKHDLSLRGASTGRTVLTYTGPPADLDEPSTYPMLMIDGSADVELSRLTFDGAGSGLVNAIRAHDSARLSLHHLLVKDFATDEAIGIHLTGDEFEFPEVGNPDESDYSGGVLDSLITHNRFENIATRSEWGAGVRVSWGSMRNTIAYNRIHRTGRGGILANNGAKDLYVHHNVVTESGLTEEGLGIELWGDSGRGVVEDNRIDHWLSLQNSDYTAVRRNVVSDKSGDVPKFIGLENAETANNVFTDNKVDSGQQIGISISGEVPKNHVVWSRNTVRNMVQWGAQIQGEDDGARYQYFYRNTFAETQQGNPYAEYPGDDGNGFRLNDGPNESITLDHNLIVDNANLGIQLTDSAEVEGLSFVGNTIAGNADASIDGYPDSAADLEWEGNVVERNGEDIQLTSRGFANAKPTAGFAAPMRGRVGVPISFANTSTDPDGSIAFSLWDFGAGRPTSDTHPRITYNNAGVYRVTLVVWDDGGRGDIVERLVRIR